MFFRRNAKKQSRQTIRNSNHSSSGRFRALSVLSVVVVLVILLTLLTVFVRNDSGGFINTALLNQQYFSYTTESQTSVPDDDQVKDDDHEEDNDTTSLGADAGMGTIGAKGRLDASMASQADSVDSKCPWRNSTIYRSVYVYPNYGDTANGWGDPRIMSNIVANMSNGSFPLPPWPWLEFDRNAKANATGHYNIHSQNVQYTTELLVRELMTNPQSCLRTNDPDKALLFHVPYMPSLEHHRGTDRETDYSTSPFGQAILDIFEKSDYSAWEQTFGFTSKYWKRRQGADHILVYSEPLHGLYHPRSKRGNFHFVNSQKQLAPPISLSVELSTTFVQMYPRCTSKNILLPYPNSDGRWFNGVFEKEVRELYSNHSSARLQEAIRNGVAVTAEERVWQEQQQRSTADNNHLVVVNDDDWTRPKAPRVLALYYRAGTHGECTGLRIALKKDIACSKSNAELTKAKLEHYTHGMRLATFCPCPGGDSPSAKRMFDAVLAGCIPVVLSYDFVWPFTKQFDPELTLDPSEFSITLNASLFDTPRLDEKTCQPINSTTTAPPSIEEYLRTLSVEEVIRLKKGVEKARHLYGWYEYDTSLVDNPLREGVLPTGGTAHFVVSALEQRAAGARWQACQEELQRRANDPNAMPDPRKFKC